MLSATEFVALASSETGGLAMASVIVGGIGASTIWWRIVIPRVREAQAARNASFEARLQDKSAALADLQKRLDDSGAQIASLVTASNRMIAHIEETKDAQLVELRASIERLAANNQRLVERNDELFRHMIETETQITRMLDGIEITQYELMHDKALGRQIERDLVASIVRAWRGEKVMFAKYFVPEAGACRMIAVCDQYASTYLGGPASFYNGKFDEEIWGKEAADLFRDADLKAMAQGQALEVKEWVESRTTGIRGWYEGVKIPVQTQRGNQFLISAGKHVYANEKTPAG